MFRLANCYINLFCITGNWSAFRLANESRNSFGRLTVHNSSCLLWQQVSLLDKSLFDEIYINQETHGMFDATIIEIVTETPPPPKTIDNSHINIVVTNNVPIDQGSGAVVIEKTPGTDFTALIIGLSSFGGAMLLLISGVLIKKFACKRRPGRRWYSVDYGRSFYSQMKNMDSEYTGDEIETSESAPNVKLLPDSSGR